MFVKLALTLRSTLDPSFVFVDVMANLASIGRDRYVSQSGLAAILKEIQTHGLPENISRSAVKRSREEDLKGMRNEYGEIIVEHKFDMVNSTKQESFHFVNPWCFLQHILTNSEPFKGYFTKYLLALGHEHTRPLRVSVYCDEVTPGNQPRHDPTRKIQIVYWTLLDGPGTGVDHLWFTLGLARSSEVNRIRGGMSEYMRGALSHFLNGRLGIRLQIDNGFHFKFLDVTMCVADEGALKDMFSFKGASGRHVCPLCHAVVAESSELHRFSSSVVPSTSTHVADWQLATDQSIRNSIRCLHSNFNVVSQKEFENMTKSCGWNYVPTGLLGTGEVDDLRIGVVSMLQYDWMHCFIVNGAWNIELGAVLAGLKTAGFNQNMLHNFLQQYTWPSQVGGKSASGVNVFKKKQEGNVKCSASEALGIYNVIKAFISKHISHLDAMRYQIDSYYTLCNVLDCIFGCRNGRFGHVDLQRHLSAFVVAHQKAYASSLWVPKHHYLQHLAMMLERHGKVVGCFVHERKHRVAKRYAENVRKVDKTFDVSVLKDVLASNIRDLQDKEILPLGIRSPKEASYELTLAVCNALNTAGDVQYGKQVHFSWGSTATVGDFLLFQGDGTQVGEAVAFISCGDDVFALVQVWLPAGQNKFNASHTKALVATEALKDTICYRRDSPTCIEVVPNLMMA